MSFLHQQNVLFLYQFGFRFLHSTTFALIEITDKIKQLLDEGNYVIGLYLDQSKAFDTVDHEILLDKLSHYGIRGHSNDFFRTYLTNRRQFTSINGKKSESRYQRCGVPQGSVLGPLFFLIYINDIQHVIDHESLRLFADDTGVFQYDKNLNRLINTVKTNFTKLLEWFKCNKLTINHTKSNFSIYHTKNRNVPNDITRIQIGDIDIKRENSVKYIGLTIDEELNWKKHIDILIKSLVKYFGLFNNIKYFVTEKLARQLYYAFIYSRIKYGIEVYGSCSLNLKKKIQVIQNKLLKLILRRHPRTSTNELHSNMKILKVEDIYTYSLSLFVHDCLHSNCPHPYTVILQDGKHCITPDKQDHWR